MSFSRHRWLIHTLITTHHQIKAPTLVFKHGGQSQIACSMVCNRNSLVAAPTVVTIGPYGCLDELDADMKLLKENFSARLT